MNTKKFLLLSFVFGSSVTAFAQNEWNSVNNSTSAMYRDGNVAIGTGATVTGYPFVVKNATAGVGTKVLFGSTTPITGVSTSNSLLEIQASGSGSASLFAQYANISGTGNNNYIMVGTFPSITNPYAGILVGKGGTNASIPFKIVNNSIEALTIWPSGQVGIGTGNVSLGTTKLAVEGLIACRELKVTLSASWPDFVFQPNYQRRTLPELKDYLFLNHHLPNMPSSAEVEQNGSFNVGEMQVKTIQSLEELYLYVMDLKAENDELKKQVLELQQKVGR
jgi:hypothetical protein